MLKVIYRQNIILLLFAGLLLEVLTPVTLVALAIGMALSFLQIRPNKWMRNTVAIGVFLSYFFTYGKVIDPEIGLNFLTSIIVLKMLERETVRDHYMIFFGLMLLISAGSLFEKTLTYVGFFGISFLVLVRDFYSFLGQKWRMKDLGLALIWVAPLTFILFFLAPRLLSPIPFNASTQRQGEIGYTPDVNLTELDTVTANTTPVFQVQVSRPLSQQELYWRGNTLTSTDGWNWNLAPKDQEPAKVIESQDVLSDQIEQNFRLFTKADYFFSLDYPVSFSYEDHSYRPGSTKTLRQRRWQWTAKYQAVAKTGEMLREEIVKKENSLLPLTKENKEWIKSTFKGEGLAEVQREIQQYFLKNKFVYSLSPGISSSFEEFIQKKKIGLCSHYASATAIILRAKDIPARLVSGFMGGRYNRFADFYLVSQNDAHVWVEAYENGQWTKLDPTEWIAPDRVLLGGDSFMQNVVAGQYQSERFFKMPDFVQDLRQWFGQWDFKFYVWLEEMDYHTQEAILSRLHLNRKIIYAVIPLLVLAFVSIYYLWFVARASKGRKISEAEMVWLEFHQKLKKLGLQDPLISLQKGEAMIMNSRHKEKEKLVEIWRELTVLSFSGQKLDHIRSKIRKI